MDSFVLAETFKYLYLLFTEKEDLVFNLNQFVFTTEAHILPLSLSTMAVNVSASQVRDTSFNNYHNDNDDDNDNKLEIYLNVHVNN